MNIAHKLADMLGYDLVRTGKNLLLHRHLRNLFTLLGTDCVLDVGANHGQYGRMLRDLGYAGEIISFEPVAASFRLLQQEARNDARWRAYAFALGAVEGEMEIQVPVSSDFASFLEPSEYGRRTFGATVTDSRRETVRIRRLDTVLDDLLAKGEPRSIHLKMDTQGFDLEVFRGARQSLARIGSLQSELSVLPVYQGMPDYLESLGEYRKAGFEVTGIFPVSQDGATLTVIEFDCLLRRPPIAAP